MNNNTNILDDLRDSLLEASSSLNSNSKRKSKTIQDPEAINKILSITHSKARTKSVLMNLFADFGEGPQFNPYDIFTIPKSSFGNLSNSSINSEREDSIAKLPNNKTINTSTKSNSIPIVTTIGLYIFNRIFTEPLSDILGYINESITKSMFEKKINVPLSHALLEDRISIKQLKNVIEDSQILMSCCSAWASSHTEKLFTIQDDIIKRKEEILKRPGIKESIDKGDLNVMKSIENELIDYSTKELLSDDPSIDMYKSDARSSIGNNFKNMYLTRSGVNQTDGSIKIVMNSYLQGLPIEDYSTIADGAVIGSFSRSCTTAKPGHMERLFLGATSHIKLLPPGSDCGTNRYITVKLTNSNVSAWFYSFIIDDKGNLIEFLPELKSEYVNKTVKFRFSSLCKAPAGFICEKCMGTLTRRMGITNIGLLSPVGMSSLKNQAMKRFHQSITSLYQINCDTIFN